MAATAVTLNDLQGHSQVVCLFKCNPSNIYAAVLPERDYVTFGSMLSPIRLVCSNVAILTVSGFRRGLSVI